MTTCERVEVARHVPDVHVRDDAWHLVIILSARRLCDAHVWRASVFACVDIEFYLNAPH